MNCHACAATGTKEHGPFGWLCGLCWASVLRILMRLAGGVTRWESR